MNVIVGVASQLSFDVGEPVDAGKVLAVHRIVIFAGQVMTGATLSITVIDCTQVDVLPHWSSAVQVRVMVLF